MWIGRFLSKIDKSSPFFKLHYFFKIYFCIVEYVCIIFASIFATHTNKNKNEFAYPHVIS